jgi:hypothetical protein
MILQSLKRRQRKQATPKTIRERMTGTLLGGGEAGLINKSDRTPAREGGCYNQDVDVGSIEGYIGWSTTENNKIKNNEMTLRQRFSSQQR